MVNAVRIAGKSIGPGHPCFVIAEAGVNHNGDRDMALRLIDAAVSAKADAVKFQTFSAERLVTRDAPKAEYQMKTGPSGESQLDMLKHLELSRDDHKALREHCLKKGILFLSTPFDAECADFLDHLGVPAFKMASGEITDLQFFKHVAAKRKPMIISSGMSGIKDVEAALQTAREAGNEELILLHCVSNYPAAASDANLHAMKTLADTFHVPVGYSDHTLGIEIALAAVALGACVIEKHLTLDKSLKGPDHQASLEPEEFKALVKGLRNVEVSLGHGRKEPAANEMPMARIARKSLIAARDIAAGTRLQAEWLIAKRPGTGLSPASLDRLIGRTAKRDIPKDTILMEEMLS